MIYINQNLIFKLLFSDTCKAGTYNSTGTCTPCLAGTFSTIGAGTCLPCSQGQWAPEGASSCRTLGQGEVALKSARHTNDAAMKPDSAGNAIDGDNTTWSESMSGATKHWFEATLYSTVEVRKVVIEKWRGFAGCTYKVYASSGSHNELCGDNQTEHNGVYQNLVVYCTRNNYKADKVKVRMEGCALSGKSLIIYELTVYQDTGI